MKIASPDCKLCAGTGFERVGDRVRTCPCRDPRVMEKNIALAEIPERWEKAEFKNFSREGGQACFESAWLIVKQYAEQWPVLDKAGLLLTGQVGTGKTHLACAALKHIIRKGFTGVFYDYGWDLLKQIQNSYNKESGTTELDVLGPATEVEVMVLDHLGDVSPSIWVLDTVSTLLRNRTNKNKTTIMTTNYSVEELKQHIGEGSVSRIYESCRIVRMDGPDYREKFRKSLGN